MRQSPRCEATHRSKVTAQGGQSIIPPHILDNLQVHRTHGECAACIYLYVILC
jgi:hypothetical protein